MSNQGSCSATPHFVLSTEGELYGEDTLDNREVVRRIHACVAACEGISTDQLEKGIIRDMQRAISEIAPLLAKAGSGPRRHAVSTEPSAGAQPIPA